MKRVMKEQRQKFRSLSQKRLETYKNLQKELRKDAHKRF